MGGKGGQGEWSNATLTLDPPPQLSDLLPISQALLELPLL